MSAMFENVSQALYFSFVVQQYPAMGKGNTRSVVEGMEKEMGITLDRRYTSMRINDLTQLELRAQCGDIRDQVRAKLDELHAQALEAKFSHERDVKRLAIRHIAAHAAAQLAVSDDCALALCWRHYLPPERRDKDFTFRQIGQEYGISKDKAARAAARLSLLLADLEADGMTQLAHGFERAGIVDPVPALIAA